MLFINAHVTHGGAVVDLTTAGLMSPSSVSGVWNNVWVGFTGHIASKLEVHDDQYTAVDADLTDECVFRWFLKPQFSAIKTFWSINCKLPPPLLLCYFKVASASLLRLKLLPSLVAFPASSRECELRVGPTHLVFIEIKKKVNFIEIKKKVKQKTRT